MKYGVMFVEDEPLIALLYEDILLETDFEIIGVYACNADALKALEQLSPDIVIVDYNLQDGPCFPIVMRLREQGKPFIVATADGGKRDPAFGSAYWLMKPFRDEEVMRALNAAATNLDKVACR